MAHPLHPALVHFPIACWSLATFSDVVGFWWGAPAWQLGGAMLTIGTATSLAAMAAGFVELLKVPPEHPASRDLNRHVALVSAAFCLYFASLMLRWSGGLLGRPAMAAVALDGAGLVLLGAAGWVGGKLVYQHRLGTSVSSTQ